MKSSDENSEKISRKLDVIISLLENILILQGSKMGISKHEIRKIASVDMNKVTSVTKLFKSSEFPQK